MRSILAISAALLACGCASAPVPPQPSAGTDEAAPRRGGTLHLASFADINTLDPAVTTDALAQQPVELLFAGLLDFDEAGKVVPDLAERFEVSPDGLEVHFFLHQGIRFHDGAPLDAEDVKRSIERALHPDCPAPFASFYDRIEGFAAYRKGTTPHLDGVRVDGALALTIRLHEPDATFLPAFAMQPLRPVCKSAGTTYDPQWAPCGAGPFKLVAGGWDRGRSLRLVRHDGYFKPGEPYLDAVEWSYGMNGVTQRFKLEAGELDGTAELSLGDSMRFRRDPAWAPFGVFSTTRSISGEGMNVEMAPFDNVEIRRAVASAIDREQYRMLRTPNLEVLTRVLSRAFVDDDPAFPGQKYDPAAALDHMARAGYPFDPKTGTGGYPNPIPYVVYKQGLLELTGQLLQQQLAKVGLRIELRIVSYPTYLALARRRGMAAFAPEGWSPDYPDRSDFFDPLFSTSAIDDESSNNSSFYSNPTLDELLVRARRELDEKARRRMYDEADAIVCNDAPWAFTVAYRGFSVNQPYVRGVRPNAVWSGDYRRIWLDRAVAGAGAHAGVLRDAKVLGALLP